MHARRWAAPIGEFLSVTGPTRRRLMVLGVYSPSIPAREILPVLFNTNLFSTTGYVPRLSGYSISVAEARRMNQHQDSAKSATNRRGRTVVCRRGDVAETANSPTS